MPRLPCARCPECRFEVQVEQPTVEAVLAAGRLLQQHLEQVHGLTAARAFALTEPWMRALSVTLDGA